MKDEGKKLAKEIEIEDVAKQKEFVGSKIEMDKSERSPKFTQPVIQSSLDEFGAGKKNWITPAELNTVKKPEPGEILAKKDKRQMMRWSKLDTYNVTHDCARKMIIVGKNHYDAIMCIMDYCVTTPRRGLVLKPYGDWDGISTDYEFEVMVRTDSNYAKCPDMRNMTGSVVYLNRVPVTFRSST